MSIRNSFKQFGLCGLIALGVLNSTSLKSVAETSPGDQLTYEGSIFRASEKNCLAVNPEHKDLCTGYNHGFSMGFLHSFCINVIDLKSEGCGELITNFKNEEYYEEYNPIVLIPDFIKYYAKTKN